MPTPPQQTPQFFVFISLTLTL